MDSMLPVRILTRRFTFGGSMQRYVYMHVVDRYFGAVSVLGVKNDQKGGEVFLSNEDHVNVQQDLGVDASAYLAVAIGAQFATKRMPLVQVLESL